MRPARRAGQLLLLTALICVSAASAAHAEKPEFSPAEKNTLTAVAGKTTFEQKEGLAAIGMEKGKGTSEITNAKEGTFDELFENCTAPLSGKCTGLEDTTLGSVLFKGTFKLGYLDAAKTKVGVAFKLKEAHFEAEKLLTLITFRGCVVASLTPINTKTKIFTATMTQSKGINGFVEILNATNTAFEKCQLESEFNGGAFKQSGLASTLTLTTSKEMTIVA
jgi:hypothetical protein